MEAATASTQRSGLAPQSPPAAALNRLRSDRVLVERYRAGDERAFDALHERHRARIYSICLGVLGSREDAQDASQEVFASAIARLRERPPHDLRPWLARVARNAAIDVARARRPGEVELRAETATEEEGPERAMERRADLERVLEGLRRLPERQRSALAMRALGGFGYAEIAGALGVDEDAVNGLIARARHALRSREESLSLACEAVREQLAAEADGRRRPGSIRRHLRSCDGCREFRDGLRADGRALRATLPGGGLGLWQLALWLRGPRALGTAALMGAKAGLAGDAVKVAATCVLSLGVAEGAREVAQFPPAPYGGGPPLAAELPRLGGGPAGHADLAAQAQAAAPGALAGALESARKLARSRRLVADGIAGKGVLGAMPDLHALAIAGLDGAAGRYAEAWQRRMAAGGWEGRPGAPPGADELQRHHQTDVEEWSRTQSQSQAHGQAPPPDWQRQWEDYQQQQQQEQQYQPPAYEPPPELEPYRDQFPAPQPDPEP